MSRTLSTASVAAAQRTAYWADLVCDAYVQLDCEPGAGASGIEGEIVADRLATLELSRVTSTAQVVRRTPARIGRAGEDVLLVSIQTQGRGVVSQDGRDAVLGPGDFALYDSTRPYTLQFDGAFQQFVLMLPGPTLRAMLPRSQRLTARRVAGDRGAGHLMSHMIGALANDIGALAPASAGAVAASVTQILVAGLSTLPDAAAPEPSSLAALHRASIRALIRQRFREPAFGPAEIAGALQLSPSTVHRAWAGEEASIADCIWALRLETARAELADPRLAARSVSQIAFGCGFNDAAHFSRAFRARFGTSPRGLRQQALPPARP
jgi:AraC-like DNA-binding protein